MAVLNHKIDFAVLIAVKNANPNGDPLFNNMPRTNAQGYGVISDVCLKRKLRNRLSDLGAEIFFTAPDRAEDGFTSLQERAENCEELTCTDPEAYKAAACRKWMDVRAFGQLFAYSTGKKARKGKTGEDSETPVSGISIGVRGPVTVQPATSLHPISIEEMKITKCFNGTTTENGKRSSDTMGDKFLVPFGIYAAYGSINARLAEKTGFSEEDAALIRHALETLFENDESSSRPSGSMEVLQVLWWQHPLLDGVVGSGTVHRSLSVSLPANPTSVDDLTVSCRSIRDVDLSMMEYGIPVTIL